MRCRKCGNEFTGGADFCSNCGRRVKKNQKLLLFIGIVLIILVVILIIWFNKRNNNKYSDISSLNTISYNYDKDNNLKFIDGNFSDNSVTNSKDALKVLESIKDKIGILNVYEELELDSQNESEGITYYKFKQMYKGIPVYKQNVILSVDKSNKVLSYSGYFIKDVNVDIHKKKNQKEIEEIVKKYLGDNAKILSNDLVVFDNKLVYVVSGYSDTKGLEVMVDANTGSILSESDLFSYAKNYSYTGEGMNGKTYTINLEEFYDINNFRTRYRFVDNLRNIHIADYRMMGPVLSTIASALPGTDPIIVDIEEGKIKTFPIGEDFIKNAITTMVQYEKIYDYYKNVLGRDSYDNKGSKIIINLGMTAKSFTNEDLMNAAWLSLTNQMYIGNWNGKSFSACLDVLAHEFTHGVIQFTVNFASTAKKEDKNKAFETGALNEGYADILGSLIEGKNWTIAEDIEVLRNLKNPKIFKNPSRKGGEYYYPDGYDENVIKEYLEKHNYTSINDYDNGGVHDNANVVGHAAYLMEEAGAFESREEMAKVWYNSLFLLSSYANFEDCALAVIKSAKNLGLSEASIYKITKSFQETNMLEIKEHSLKGVVSSGEEKINNAKVELYAYADDTLIKSITTNYLGGYELNVPAGTYKIKFSKEGFREFYSVIVITGDVHLDIELASSINNNSKCNNCKNGNCHAIKIYYLEGGNQNDLDVQSQVCSVDDGTVLDVNTVLSTVNKIFKSDVLQTDGKSFYMNFSGIEMEFGWYYKGTDVKFNWNEPIVKDIEIEMKLFDGALDNDIFINIDSFFKK